MQLWAITGNRSSFLSFRCVVFSRFFGVLFVSCLFSWSYRSYLLSLPFLSFLSFLPLVLSLFFFSWSFLVLCWAFLSLSLFGSFWYHFIPLFLNLFCFLSFWFFSLVYRSYFSMSVFSFFSSFPHALFKSFQLFVFLILFSVQCGHRFEHPFFGKWDVHQPNPTARFHTVPSFLGLFDSVWMYSQWCRCMFQRCLRFGMINLTTKEL